MTNEKSVYTIDSCERPEGTVNQYNNLLYNLYNQFPGLQEGLAGGGD